MAVLLAGPVFGFETGLSTRIGNRLATWQRQLRARNPGLFFLSYVLGLL